MNFASHRFAVLPAAVAALLLLAGCATSAQKPDGAAAVRSKLTQLQADPQLASRAPVAIKDAEVAVAAAEVPRDDIALSSHLVLIADRKVDIARAQAQGRLSEDQRKALAEQREKARLDSRTREVDNARGDASVARIDADQARDDAQQARDQADLAQRQASSALTEASAARGEADDARMDSAMAQQQSEALKLQITLLNAKTTDRGLVITLGDVLFASGGSTLKGGVASNLGKLATFLNQYPDRTAIVEGHTDSVGSSDSNQGLSQRRADSVKSYLVAHGIDSARIIASGLGEDSPVAGNDSSTGRQQNRRVEVIISNTVTSQR